MASGHVSKEEARCFQHAFPDPLHRMGRSRETGHGDHSIAMPSLHMRLFAAGVRTGAAR